MACKNCDPFFNYAGRVIHTTSDGKCCAICKTFLIRPKRSNSKWDTYFHSICIAVASKSPCLSRKIGAILVKDHSIVSTGFNGPSRGIPHCGYERIIKDDSLSHELNVFIKEGNSKAMLNKTCIRKALNYDSGTHMELCPAQHAEANAVSNAARLGVSTVGTTLYMNCVIPCKNCFGTLINAGIVEIVVDDTVVYDKHTQFLIDNSNIKIRRFEL